jgi:hypothetical protein
VLGSADADTLVFSSSADDDDDDDDDVVVNIAMRDDALAS